MINAQLCRLYPEPHHTALFRRCFRADSSPEALLRPPEGWRTAQERWLPGHAGEVHRALYDDTSVTYADLYRLLPTLYAVEGDGSGNPLSALRLLGDHAEAGARSDVAPDVLREMRNILAEWPMVERISGRDQGGEPESSRVGVARALREAAATLRRAILSVADIGTGFRGAVERRDEERDGMLPYALRPRRADFVRQALGVPALLHSERVVAPGAVRHDVVHVYFDVSGSMDAALPALYATLASLSGLLHPRVHLFSTRIDDIDLRQLARGVRVTTGGTDIAPVTRHVLDQRRAAGALRDRRLGRAGAAGACPRAARSRRALRRSGDRRWNDRLCRRAECEGVAAAQTGGIEMTKRDVKQMIAQGRHEAAEFVLPGHPDKLCDAVADAIVGYFQKSDPFAQCGIEVACVFRPDGRHRASCHASAESRKAFRLGSRRHGPAASTHRRAMGAMRQGTSGTPLPAELTIQWMLCCGPFAQDERELRHLSDDQAICVGYALRSPQTGYLPPAHWLARRIGQELARLRGKVGAGQIGPDGKVIVHGTRTGRGGAFRPELVSVSLNHQSRSEWLLLRRVVEEAVECACAGMALPDIDMNGAGMFVAGGPNGDNGLSGKKLVVDAYGPGVPIGGGAWSGKDFFKVDRLGGMAARRLALESLLASDADEALVTLTYLPGGDRPARVDLLLDGRPSSRVVVPMEFGALESAVLHGLLQVDPGVLVELARWGHQRAGMPWELPVSELPGVSARLPQDRRSEIVGARACVETVAKC